MPVYVDTPLATQQINQTQAPIRTNFTSIEELIVINHVDFTDPINFGKHNVTQFVPQVNTPLGSVPTFVTGIAANEFNIYNSVPNGTSVLTGTPNQGYPVTLTTNELIIERGVQGGTKNTFTPFTAAVTGVDSGNPWGWTFLASGILLKWGQINTNVTNGTWSQFFYPTGANIPEFNSVFIVHVQPVSLDNPTIPQTAQISNYLTVNNTFTPQYFWWVPKTNFGNQNQRSLFYYAIGTAQSNT